MSTTTRKTRFSPTSITAAIQPLRCWEPPKAFPSTWMGFADLLLMDGREGVLAARNKGLTVTGTLGLLGLAAQHGLIDLAEAFDRIKRTNFRYRQSTMDALLSEISGKG